MKQLLLLVAFFTSVSAFAGPGVDEKVLAAFNQTFTNAEEVSWSTVGNNYEVKFRHNEIRTRVTYDSQGEIINTLRYYKEEKLPLMVLSNLKSRFPGRTVFGVTEESSEGGITYHVILEDAKTWLDVTADTQGNLTVNRKFTKA